MKDVKYGSYVIPSRFLGYRDGRLPLKLSSKKINSLLDRMSDGPLIVAGFSVRYHGDHRVRAGAHDRLHEIFSRFLYFSLNIIFLMK